MRTLPLTAVMALGLALLNCDGESPTQGEPPALLVLEGVVVKDLNTGTDIASVTIAVDDTTAYSGATVKINRTTLSEVVSERGTYYSHTPLIAFRHGQVCTLHVISDDSTIITSTATVPDTFAIYSIPDSANEGGKKVPFEWHPSWDADGYIISIKGPPQAIKYTDLVEHNSTSYTIEPRAFRETDGDLVLGDYEVHVIAYNTTFAPYFEVPLPLPSGLPADTVQGNRVTFGAGVIAEARTITVLEGP